MDECAPNIMKLKGKDEVLEENTLLKPATFKGHWKFSLKISSWLKKVL